MSEPITVLNSFLRMAVMAGVERSVQIHIDRGDDINARDLNGRTPLMLAASKNKSNICKMLLDAGADYLLTDPAGKTAYLIAFEANAVDTASMLKALNAESKSSVTSFVNQSNAYDLTSEIPQVLDVTEWESEEVNEPPEADLSLSLASSAIQVVISNHKPIDKSEDWDDVDLYLPESSLRIIQKDDLEGREHLRLLLLRAIREGSVPVYDVESLFFNQDLSEMDETKAIFSMLINDIGAELDERNESFDNTRGCGVFICPKETADEENILYEAFAHIDSVASRRSEPLRLYQKDMLKKPRISGEDEIVLAKSMEIELERALDALASWPAGIAHTIAIGDSIRCGKKPLSWFSSLSAMEQDEVDVQLDSVVEDEVKNINFNEDTQYEDEDTVSKPLLGSPESDFLDLLTRLEVLTKNPTLKDRALEIRDVLAALGLNRRFLVELAEIGNKETINSSALYLSAIEIYKKAHDRMAEANLRLVFHLSRKFLYCGEPLDDLVQEGNLGLLKAVDRFDWRRGFKFSTYATWWIRQSISRYISDKGRTIRLPVHIHESASRLNREAEAFEFKVGRMPTVEELASLLDSSERKVKFLMELPPEAESINELEIDQMISVESRSVLTPPDPFEIVFKKELSREVENFLLVLDSRQQEVIRLRNGLGSDDGLTLEEVGNIQGVTRERIRQIEAKAIKKLMHPSRLEALALNVLGIAYTQKKEEASEYE